MIHRSEISTLRAEGGSAEIALTENLLTRLVCRLTNCSLIAARYDYISARRLDLQVASCDAVLSRLLMLRSRSLDTSRSTFPFVDNKLLDNIEESFQISIRDDLCESRYDECEMRPADCRVQLSKSYQAFSLRGNIYSSANYLNCSIANGRTSII